MVKQARDQLQSNETQDDIKAVFEGSCNLIPIKLVRKECDKLADDFIPELIEALASQMDPNVVCSVAGLCNNAAIDKMLAERPPEGVQIEDLSEINFQIDQSANKVLLSCHNCNEIGKVIEDKFVSKNRDEILGDMLEACGTLSSLSDGCSNIVIKYFNNIYDHLNENLKAENICHLSGVCSGRFHQHDDDAIEIRPMSAIGVVGGDDIPCELCEQLVTHLRDLLVANTTEAEFKMVLEGLCNQTQSFKSECTSLVDQYYDVIYRTLVDNLDANGACFMIGVCKKGKTVGGGPLMPLIASETAASMQLTNKPHKLLGEDEPVFTEQEISNMQLPIDVLLGAPNAGALVQTGEWCTMCEFFLHFVQDSLSTPVNEEEIKRTVSEVCDKMSKAIASQCHNFVNTYGDAVIALLVQEIAPATICPQLRLCPRAQPDAEVFSPISVQINTEMTADQPKCPLCMFAVTEAIAKIRSDKTKENVIHTLDTLCDHLPAKLRPECRDFVETYSKELIEMLATDFTPQQICVYLKLCVDNKPDTSMIDIENKLLGDPAKYTIPIVDDEGIDNELSKCFGVYLFSSFSQFNSLIYQFGFFLVNNEIPDDTVNGQFVDGGAIEYEENPECKICEEIIKEVERKVVNKKAKDQIEHALHKACERMKKFKAKCDRYVDKYEEQIIDGIMKNLAPKEICHQIKLCQPREIDNQDCKFLISHTYNRLL